MADDSKHSVKVQFVVDGQVLDETVTLNVKQFKAQPGFITGSTGFFGNGGIQIDVLGGKYQWQCQLVKVGSKVADPNVKTTGKGKGKTGKDALDVTA